MTQREQAPPGPIALLRAAARGAALAAAASLLVHACGSLRALEICSAALLALALGRLVRRARTTATAVPAEHDAAGLRLLVAGSSAGALLWVLSPWTATPPQPASPSALPQGEAERDWLCHMSLLSTPYQQPRAHVLIAADAERSALLRICAEARVHGSPRVLAADPALHGGVSPRALARSGQLQRYDLVLLAPQPPSHPLPLGLLPLARAPLETVEGVRDLLAGLPPNGLIAATVLGEPVALRWLHAARAALDALAARQPSRHLVVYGAAGAYTLFLRSTPFDLDSVLDMHSAHKREGPEAPAGLRPLPAWLRTKPELQATPGAAFETRIADEIRARDPERAADAYAFDIHAATDDHPLFFESTRADRRDTWSAGTSYRVLPRAAALAALLALVLAWLAARDRARDSKLATRLRLIGGYGGLALGHGLIYGCAQRLLGLWLPLPASAPALCALVLGGGAGAWFALRPPQPRARSLVGAALQLTAAAAAAALARIAAPSLALAHRLDGEELGWVALAALGGLGAALTLGAIEIVRQTKRTLRASAGTIYLAWLAPATVLGPTIVLLSGYRSCALWGAAALALAALAAPAASDADRLPPS